MFRGLEGFACSPAPVSPAEATGSACAAQLQLTLGTAACRGAENAATCVPTPMKLVARQSAPHEASQMKMACHMPAAREFCPGTVHATPPGIGVTNQRILEPKYDNVS